MTERLAEFCTRNKVENHTDNNSLAYLNTTNLGALEQGWMARLSCFDYIMKYKPGYTNINCDTLSRNPCTYPVGDKDADLEDIEIPPLRVVGTDTVITCHTNSQTELEMYT